MSESTDTGTAARPLIVGIAGGVGSGKTSVAKAVTDVRVLVIEADRIGHDVLSEPEVVHRLTEAFGPGVIDEDGRISRAAVAAMVFGEDQDSETHRRQLESIVHPVIRKAVRQQIAACPPSVEVIILDAALLLESGWKSECDAVVYVDTPKEQRLARVIGSRGWTAEELDRRERAQWPLQKKRQSCDFSISNAGSPAESAAALSAYLKSLIDQHSAERPNS